LGCENPDELKEEHIKEELRNWTSFRGQTLSRTGDLKRLENFVKLDSDTK
jgi:hypothetical protein